MTTPTRAIGGRSRLRGGYAMTDFALGQSSPVELRERLAAERRGEPHIVLRDGRHEQLIVALDPERPRVTIGRGEGCDVHLPWDAEASRVHAELELLGGVWTVVDDGLSSNGTLVNGARISSRRRLRDQDTLRIGQTLILFRDPARSGQTETRIGEILAPPKLSDAQKRVLLALCRPYRNADQFTTPATNQQIADELFLSVEAAKTHLRALFAKFEVEDLPQNQKRTRLVERAFLTGAVSERDL